MIMTKKGWQVLRESFGYITQSQVNEISFLIAEFDKDKSITYPHAAYMLGTTWWETAKTMLPIEEYGKGKGKKYGKHYDIDGSIYKGLDHIYYGRGYVQLTWLSNYAMARDKIGVDFVNNPDYALHREHAVKILITGMKEGWFTGRSLSTYLPRHQCSYKDYVNARRIINGTDKAQAIANIAIVFERALRCP